MTNNRYQFVISTIKSAGELLLNISGRELDVRTKNDDIQNIVTNGDIDVSDFITSEIKRNFEGEIIYSEEVEDVDISSGSYWSIDPVDGTSNFSRNIPHFSVVITYVDAGVPLVGAIYNPRTQELFSFERNHGAFLNDKKVSVSKIEDISLAHAFLRMGRDKKQWDWGFRTLQFLLENANKTSNFGSSALDLCFVGAGRTEICIYGTLTTVDIAAAIGFVNEAGGIVVDSGGIKITKLTKDKQVIIAVNNSYILSSIKACLVN